MCADVVAIVVVCRRTSHAQAAETLHATKGDRGHGGLGVVTDGLL
jgi:hypothetical protein